METISVKECCCSMGLAWGRRCERCPQEGSGKLIRHVKYWKKYQYFTFNYFSFLQRNGINCAPRERAAKTLVKILMNAYLWPTPAMEASASIPMALSVANVPQDMFSIQPVENVSVSKFFCFIIYFKLNNIRNKFYKCCKV